MLRDVLNSTMPKATFDEAVQLVGILFEYQFRVSPKYVKNYPAPIHFDWHYGPLEPQAAAVYLAEYYGFDCDRLYFEFHSRWATLRDSVSVKSLKAKLASHEYIDALVLYEGPTP